MKNLEDCSRVKAFKAFQNHIYLVATSMDYPYYLGTLIKCKPCNLAYTKNFREGYCPVGRQLLKESERATCNCED